MFVYFYIFMKLFKLNPSTPSTPLNVSKNVSKHLNYFKHTSTQGSAIIAAAVAFSSFSAAVAAQTVVHELGTITVTETQASSLPTHISTVFEGVSGEQIAQTINATDSSDALKYLPSLNVRKRYIGDYNHAVLASRASGTGNSARSLVYADGILLSN
jgi:iron complex outermembrane recepter protein